MVFLIHEFGTPIFNCTKLRIWVEYCSIDDARMTFTFGTFQFSTLNLRLEFMHEEVVE